jgi:septation ring formation regulator EzrA
VNEAHFREIDRTLLFISDARKRVEKTVKQLRRDGAEAHLVDALEEADRELEAVSRRLMQQTYWAVPKEQLSLEEPAEELTLS